MPWRITRYLATLRLESDSSADAFQRSSRSGVTSSSRRSPRSRTSRSAAWRYSVSVERLRHGRARSSGATPPRRPRAWRRWRPSRGARCDSRARGVVEPVLRQALREVAGRRPPARRPRRAEHLLDLAARRQPVLRVPRPARARSTREDVTGGREHRGRNSTPISGQIGDTLRFGLSERGGTRGPQNRPFAATTRRRNRTFQAGGCPALPVLKTGWATRPLPRRRGCYARRCARFGRHAAQIEHGRPSQRPPARGRRAPAHLPRPCSSASLTPASSALIR